MWGAPHENARGRGWKPLKHGHFVRFVILDMMGMMSMVSGCWYHGTGRGAERRQKPHTCMCFPKLLRCSKGEPDPTTRGGSTVSPRGVIPGADITSRRQTPPSATFSLPSPLLWSLSHPSPLHFTIFLRVVGQISFKILFLWSGGMEVVLWVVPDPEGRTSGGLSR